METFFFFFLNSQENTLWTSGAPVVIFIFGSLVAAPGRWRWLPPDGVAILPTGLGHKQCLVNIS